MALREIDAISDAIIETEREIAGSAWDQEDTEREDGGDRSLEAMGDGLEGQQEPEEDDELEGEEADGELESEGDVEAEGDKPVAGKEGEGDKPVAEKPALRAEPEGGRVPPGKLREANERARAAETERDALKAQIEASKGENKSLTDKFDLVMREIEGLKRAPRAEPPKPAEAAKPAEAPDIFENPKGFVDHLTGMFQSELSKRDTQISNQRVETSMAIAHAIHKDTFANAFEAINKLNPQNPDDRVVVQRIYASSNPGEALVSWHKRSQTLAEVGDDPAAFREKVRSETREALMKDPEFRKQLVAELRGDAARGDNGNPRTTTRLPGSLARAGGSNLGADRGDLHGHDDSEQGVADAAWR